MPITLSKLCTTLNRPYGVIRDIQKRFELPVFKGAGYTDSYAAFLRTIIHLRIFGISFDSLTRLWQREQSVMRLLHADSTGSPTWFLDSCGSKGRPSRRLLLSHFDIGVPIHSGSVQLGLNFAKEMPELFTSAEMGEDVLQALNRYLKEYRAITLSLQTELPVIQSALALIRPLVRTPLKRTKRSRTAPKSQSQAGFDLP